MTISGFSRRAILAAALLTASYGSAAHAQTAPQTEDTGEEVIVTGTRTTGFKASDSPSPIQLLGNDALKRVGQPDLMQALAQTLPSIQVQAFGSDLSAFHPSIKLRGLSPNHTLILVDGKRRHGTANVGVAGGIFGGNAAPDIALIPEDAIDHIEVLQDGAAAQYGTDAIAGVINFILKRKDHGGDINITGGRYMDQGGQTWDVMGNIGLKLWDGAFLNLTGERKYHNYSFRGDLDPRVVDTGVNSAANTGVTGGRFLLANFPALSQVGDYPYVNRIVGDGKYKLAQGFYNFGWDVSPDVQLYSFGSYSERDFSTFQNFRVPTVIFGKRPRTGTAAATSAATSADFPFQQGFKPREVGEQTDYQATVGAKGTIMDTTWDVSSSYGRDELKVFVKDSANAALYYDTSTTTSAGYTPRDVYNGAFVASQWTNNLDLTHKFDVGLFEPLTLAGGLEYRRELYQLRAGEVASYYIGSGVAQGGIQSFFGYAPTNASTNTRRDFSQYLDVSVKPIEQWLVDAAVRHEHYSDFGDTTIWKITSRFDITPEIAVRGTASTGFRAPTLAEGFYSGINVGPSSLSGIFAPNSAGAAALGIGNLQPEKSLNFSAGVVLKPIPRLLVTIDAYSIRIKDRIVQSGAFTGATSVPNTPLSPNVLTALRANGVPIDNVIALINSGAAGSVTVNTFVNGLTTRTQGIDFSATYPITLPEMFSTDLGTVDLSLALNYNKTKIKKINPPPSGVNQTVPILNVDTQSLFTKASPQWRATGGAFWQFGKFSLNLRESVYGNAYSLSSLPSNGSIFVKVGTGIRAITDLEASFKPVKAVKLSIGANNLFNTYPKAVPDYIRAEQFVRSSTAFITKYPSISPIGINGGYYYGRVTFSW